MSIVEFLNGVPHELTLALVGLSPYISKLRSVAQVVSWRSPWYNSCLSLAVWWTVCLLAQPTLRYLFPIIFLSAVSLAKWTSHPPSASPLVTEHNLQATISDLTVIHSLIPIIPELSFISLTTILRVSAILYIPYLLLTYFVSLQVILGMAGSLLLTWRAPWVFQIRSSLGNSAWVRWSIYHLCSQLTGQALPPRTLSSQPIPTSPQPVNTIRFLFTVYENQRWWMGLDWTAALLPGERPSWCSAAHHAVSPPNAFALPDDTTVFVEDGSGRTVKRTATWKWEGGEWGMLVRKDGGGLSRVETPFPTAKEEPLNGSRLSKATGKMKESSSVGSFANPSVNSEEVAGSRTDGANLENDPAELPQEEATDADGWIYGDNKWEGQSGKGGMGKYTRYRRWTRVAVVSEVVELVEDSGGTQGGNPSDTIHGISDSQPSTRGLHDEKGDHANLRQRLQLALNSDSHMRK